MKQKFPKGTLVRIAKDLGPSMSHFPCDQWAIVNGTYNELCSFSDRGHESYSLEIIADTVSWYDENQLRKAIKKEELECIKMGLVKQVKTFIFK